jgi:hypothetical protein
MGTITLWILILLTALAGCGKADTTDHPAEDHGSSIQTPQTSAENQPAEPSDEETTDEEGAEQDASEQAEEEEEEEREPVDHPPAFDPQQVRVGDRIAGLEVKDIRVGDTPYSHVLVDLEGQLMVTGTYIQVNDMWIFRPDASEREHLPHVEGQQVKYYLGEEMVPRLTNLRFRNMDQFGVEPSYVRVGRATVVLEDYRVQYVPGVNLNNVQLTHEPNGSYLELGDQRVELGLRYVDDSAKLASIIFYESYHELEPGVLEAVDENARSGSIGKWQGLDISMDLLAAWDADNDLGFNYGYLIGNHSSILWKKELELPDIGNVYLFAAERDRWDESINFYNGVEYEYWLVALREVPDVRLEGDDYRYAFSLIVHSDERIMDAEEWMKQLAAYWRVPPEDFYIDN